MSPVADDERHARLLLGAAVEPGDPDVGRLVRDFSAVELVARLRRRGLAQAKASAWAERLASTDVERLLEIAARVGARFVVPGDVEWPLSLDQLSVFESGPADRRAGAPLGLWVRGAPVLAATCATSVAVVGARAASEYGLHVAGDLGGGCAQQGVAVVSGAAYGIDAAAHRGALAVGGRTVAVVAGGVDVSSPAGLAALLAQIAADGLVVSEAAPGSPPSRSRFLVRNRLIAALSQGTVVVEAALRSGALSTARWARDLHRVVMGVPGPVTSMLSAGVHELLRQPETNLVARPSDVLELVAPLLSTEPRLPH